MRSLRLLERHSAVLDLRVDVRLVGRSGTPPQTADDEHSAIVGYLAAWLRGAAWTVELEASFNEYGERGRIDLLAFHAATGTVLVIEVKTLLVDLQDTLGALNVKTRLAHVLARRRGWRCSRTATVLAVAGTPLNRSVVTRNAMLFRDFPVRRLSRSSLETTGQMLTWVAPGRASRDRWLAGRQRVRP